MGRGGVSSAGRALSAAGISRGCPPRSTGGSAFDWAVDCCISAHPRSSNSDRAQSAMRCGQDGHRHGLPRVIAFGYGTGAMHGRRAVSVAATMVLAAVLLLAVALPAASAADSALRLVDANGVLHLTNVPADPRYRGLPGASGTGAGWLRLPPP